MARPFSVYKKHTICIINNEEKNGGVWGIACWTEKMKKKALIQRQGNEKYQKFTYLYYGLSITDNILQLVN